MGESKKSARVEFGEQLREYRKQAGISQGNLAKATQKSQPNIVSVEKGDIGIGIDNMEEIATFFGVKYYDFANPKTPIPSKGQLRESIVKYLIAKGFDPSYIKDENAPSYAKNMDTYLASGQLNEPKTSYQISKEYEEMFHEKISPSKVSDILGRTPRSGLVDVAKVDNGTYNVYKLKRAKNSTSKNL